MRSEAPPGAEKSIPELMHDLGEQLGALVRGEIALAKAALAEKAAPFAAAAAILAVAAVLGLGALGAVTAAIIAAIALALPLWAAALITAAAYGAVAGGCALVALRAMRRAGPPIPTRTIESVKEDVAWVATRARSGAR